MEEPPRHGLERYPHFDHCYGYDPESQALACGVVGVAVVEEEVDLL